MNEQLQTIKEYLEAAYTGAHMMDDAEAMDRISRAIIAIETPADVDIFDREFFENHMKGVFSDGKS